MRKIIFTPMVLLVSVLLAMEVSASVVNTDFAFEDNLDTIADSQANEPEKVVDNDVIYLVAETMPEFPGGMQQLFQFLADSVKYPAEAHKRKIEGRVICQFVVEKDGRITDVYAVRSSGSELLDKEAVRVLRTMPNWRPGAHKGKPVRVKYTVPVFFRLK